LTEENIEIEIDLQEKIIKTLKNLSIPEEIFSSLDSYQAAKDFVNSYAIKTVEARLDYLKLTLETLKNPSISDSSKSSLIDIATIPNLEATGKKLRELYLK
jgi:hypothetical protein